MSVVFAVIATVFVVLQLYPFLLLYLYLPRHL